MSNRKRLKRPRKPKHARRPTFRFGTPITAALQGWARMAAGAQGSSGLLSSTLGRPGRWRTPEEES